MRDDRERLRDIQEAIERIERHTASGRTAFQQDELIQNWVVHHLEVLGEAVRHLSGHLKERHPEIPWLQIVGMRNILAHNYFAIDHDAVWQVVEGDLPRLKRSVQTLLQELDG